MPQKLLQETSFKTIGGNPLQHFFHVNSLVTTIPQISSTKNLILYTNQTIVPTTNSTNNMSSHKRTLLNPIMLAQVPTINAQSETISALYCPQEAEPEFVELHEQDCKVFKKHFGQTIEISLAEIKIYRENTNSIKINAGFCTIVQENAIYITDFFNTKLPPNVSYQKLPVSLEECRDMLYKDKCVFGKLENHEGIKKTNNKQIQLQMVFGTAR